MVLAPDDTTDLPFLDVHYGCELDQKLLSTAPLKDSHNAVSVLGWQPGAHFGNAEPHKKPASRSSSQGLWSLVWCDERCHKPGNDQIKVTFARAVREMSGALICQRKAFKFASWVSSTSPRPLVLVTSWREAKPCIDAMASSTWKPLVTVVVTSSQKVSAKAGEWVQAQIAERPHDLIMVIQDLHPQLLVAHLLNMFGGLLGSPGYVTADDVAPMSAPPGLDALASEPTVLPVPAARREAAAAEPCADGWCEDARRGKLVVPPPIGPSWVCEKPRSLPCQLFGLPFELQKAFA
mmetsp:Transcript_42178/g.108691  ORF Transcript_42178/g.108691 Transcript_42178/m.108691 type:complete len:293 (-) Transcript_42178:58-936(-)